MPQLDYLSQFLLSIQMLNIKSMCSGLCWWLSTGCLPMGTEPVHQQVWWEEQAEDGAGRKGRDRGRVTGSCWLSPWAGASPSVCCSHPKPLSRAEPTSARRDRAPGKPRSCPRIVHIPSHLPPLHLPKLDIAMKKD